MVNSQARDPLSIVEHGRLAEPFYFAPVQKRLQNVLLHIQIVVHHLLESLPQFRQVLHRLSYTQIPLLLAGSVRSVL